VLPPGSCGREQRQQPIREQPVNDSIETTAKISTAEETWSVVVLYEDKASRECAMVTCDRLVKQFWAEVEFDFHWWRMDFLVDPGMARTAARDAREADCIIFSSVTEGEFSPTVLQWVEQWADQRGDREGMLLGLTPATSPGIAPITQRQLRLREIANRARLDYVTQFPSQFSAALPDSWQNAEARAGQVTSVLNEILNRVPLPSHFGINE
jgi:hypothetical protein